MVNAAAVLRTCACLQEAAGVCVCACVCVCVCVCAFVCLCLCVCVCVCVCVCIHTHTHSEIMSRSPCSFHLSLFNFFLHFFPDYLRKSLELFEKETDASRDLTSKSNSSTCAPRLELSSNSTALPPKSAQISLFNEKLKSIEGDIRAQQARSCGVKTQERSGAKKT